MLSIITPLKIGSYSLKFYNESLRVVFCIAILLAPDIHYISTIYPLYILSTVQYPLYNIHYNIHYISAIYPLYIHCTRSTVQYPLYIHYISNKYPLYIQYISTVYPIYIQYTHSVLCRLQGSVVAGSETILSSINSCMYYLSIV